MSLGASWTMAGSGIILGSSDRTCCAVAAKFWGNSFPFDVAIGNSTTDPSISLGDGSGGVTILAQRPAVPLGAFAIAAADFDGDLLPDLAVAPNDLVSSKAQIRLFRGVGDGTFTEPGRTWQSVPFRALLRPRASMASRRRISSSPAELQYRQRGAEHGPGRSRPGQAFSG